MTPSYVPAGTACSGSLVSGVQPASTAMLARVTRSQEVLRASRGVVTRSLHATAAPRSDIDLLQKLLDAAKAREAEEAAAAKAAMAAEASGGGSKFQVQGFNALSPVGTELFPKSSFWLTGSCGELPDGVEAEPHAILLRSHKLQPDEVGDSVRAIARFGAGTNNIPIDAMTQRGIPVFNTPGANANSVKELVLAGLLLGARGVVEGIQHVNDKIVPEENGDFKKVAARIEKDKKHFGGHELVGKTLAIAGLGNIGNLVADAALALGMNVVGYDPKISVDAAWRVPREVQKAASLTELFSKADYVSINMPYIKGAVSAAAPLPHCSPRSMPPRPVDQPARPRTALPPAQSAAAHTLTHHPPTKNHPPNHPPARRPSVVYVQTHHIIDAEVLGAMKPTTNILNFSRAEIIDGAALKRCFDNGHSGSAPPPRPRPPALSLGLPLEGDARPPAEPLRARSIPLTWPSFRSLRSTPRPESRRAEFRLPPPPLERDRPSSAAFTGRSRVPPSRPRPPPVWCVAEYICDFADEHMQGHPKFICIPHLGASTEEAEDNCAIMGSRQVTRRPAPP